MTTGFIARIPAFTDAYATQYPPSPAKRFCQRYARLRDFTHFGIQLSRHQPFTLFNINDVHGRRLCGGPVKACG